MDVIYAFMFINECMCDTQEHPNVAGRGQWVLLGVTHAGHKLKVGSALVQLLLLRARKNCCAGICLILVIDCNNIRELVKVFVLLLHTFDLFR